MSQHDFVVEGSVSDHSRASVAADQMEMSQSQWGSMQKGTIGSSARDIHDDNSDANTSKIISAVEKAADEIYIGRVERNLDRNDRYQEHPGVIDCGCGDIYARHIGSGSVDGGLSQIQDDGFGEIGREAKATDYEGFDEIGRGSKAWSHDASGADDQICTAWKLPANDDWGKR